MEIYLLPLLGHSCVKKKMHREMSRPHAKLQESIFNGLVRGASVMENDYRDNHSVLGLLQIQVIGLDYKKKKISHC